jgi:hypothetical protein
MIPAEPPLPFPLSLPEPDAIRAAIDVADERARMLRRLLRLSMRLKARPYLTSTAPTAGTPDAFVTAGDSDAR